MTRRKMSSMSPSRSLGQKRLAAKYVAIVTGRPVDRRAKRAIREVITGTQKRATFERGKSFASIHLRHGCIVELRKDTEQGGIIERVTMHPRGEAMFTWKPTFET